MKISKRQLKRIIREEYQRILNENRVWTYEEILEADPESGIDSILLDAEELASYGKQPNRIRSMLNSGDYGYNSELVDAVVDYLERQGSIKTPQSYQVSGRYRLNPSHPGD